MTSTSISRPSFVRMPLFVIRSIPRRLQLDVGARVGRRQRAVVADEALREWGIVGQHLREERLVTPALLPQVGTEHLAHDIIGFADRALGMRPFGVDDHRA